MWSRIETIVSDKKHSYMYDTTLPRVISLFQCSSNVQNAGNDEGF